VHLHVAVVFVRRVVCADRSDMYTRHRWKLLVRVDPWSRPFTENFRYQVPPDSAGRRRSSIPYTSHHRHHVACLLLLWETADHLRCRSASSHTVSIDEISAYQLSINSLHIVYNQSRSARLKITAFE